MLKNGKMNESPLQEKRYVTKIEYVSICLVRAGAIMVSTLSGLAATFTYELYYGQVGVTADELANIQGLQTTITTVLSYGTGLLISIIAHKWVTKWGRYRQWYLIGLVPVFLLTLLNYYIPTGWEKTEMIAFRYVLAILSTIFGGFNNLGTQIPQVISPNYNEKKTVATAWQLFYYLGYGGAYLFTFIFPDDKLGKDKMYMYIAIFAASVTAIGQFMCAVFCKERIEPPKKQKVKVTSALFSLFKYKNYRSYYYMQWANTFRMLGKMSTYLAAITVGSSKNLLLTLPTAIGTVVGNVITARVSKKYEPTKLLKFCGFYSMACSVLIFATCFFETKVLGISFYEGWNAIFFYVFYFFFGIGVGIQELSTSHFTVEFNDYLEWETGERLEAIHGTVPGWISNVLGYLKELLIPYMLAAIGYQVSTTGNLVETMKALPTYWDTCMWLLAFLVFGYSLANLISALILKFGYDIEGEKKLEMYADLKEMRELRDAENKT